MHLHTWKVVSRTKKGRCVEKVRKCKGCSVEVIDTAWLEDGWKLSDLCGRDKKTGELLMARLGNLDRLGIKYPISKCDVHIPHAEKVIGDVKIVIDYTNEWGCYEWYLEYYSKKSRRWKYVGWVTLHKLGLSDDYPAEDLCAKNLKEAKRNSLRAANKYALLRKRGKNEKMP